MFPNLKLNEKILILRKRKKVSQKELADAIGINSSNIPHYESGFYKPGADILIKLAQYFDITLDDLLKDE